MRCGPPSFKVRAGSGEPAHSFIQIPPQRRAEPAALRRLAQATGRDAYRVTPEELVQAAGGVGPRALDACFRIPGPNAGLADVKVQHYIRVPVPGALVQFQGILDMPAAMRLESTPALRPHGIPRAKTHTQRVGRGSVKAERVAVFASPRGENGDRDHVLAARVDRIWIAARLDVDCDRDYTLDLQLQIVRLTTYCALVSGAGTPGFQASRTKVRAGLVRLIGRLW